MKDDLTVRVSRRFAQPPAAVFDGWLDREVLRRFIFTTSAAPLVRCDVDARTDGVFVMTDRRPEGDVEHHGRYLEIARPNRLVFSYGVPAVAAEQDVVTLTFEGSGDGCEVTLTTQLQPEWAEYVDGARQAWSAMLDGLAVALERSISGGTNLPSGR